MVVLQVDHVVPVAEGGTDDMMNLVTSCWECNSGKRDVPLDEIITGEDPHDRAIMLLERERQLREYNDILARSYHRRRTQAELLESYWREDLEGPPLREAHFTWMVNVLENVPYVYIQQAMDIAAANGKMRDLRYVMAVMRNWKAEGKWPAFEL